MSHQRLRLSLVEYGAPVDLSRQIAAASGFDLAKADSLLREAGSRAAQSLGLSYNPIRIEAKGARAIDFAGILRIAPALELEVAPKFLGLDDSDAGWREDFFFLSTLSRHGRLLGAEHLNASGGAPRDLATLVARAMTGMYGAQKRRPLRSYHKVREEDFYIEGDPDPVDLLFPTPDGFSQELTRFDRRNGWNADIVAAAKALLLEVRDPAAASALVRLIEDLSPQSAPANRRKPLPARQRAWKPLHELSVDVLGGLGVNYKQGQAHAPGYLVKTWRAWEDLLTVAAKLAFGRAAVASQSGYALGARSRPGRGAVTTLAVYPDCVIEAEAERPRMLLDAKYKGHVEKGALRISEADIYEALAFARATGCERVVLAYPAQPDRAAQPAGSCSVFERVQVETVQIIGMQVECRGISRAGGLQLFAAHLRTGLGQMF